MRSLLPENLVRLAEEFPEPLYLVGGSVRDYLCGYVQKSGDFCDFDICAPASAEVFVSFAKERGFHVHSVYKHTGTVKLSDPAGVEYEYACFRSDEYVRGEHTPAKVSFTRDMPSDARRRDFTCNAVYYAVKEGRFVDPLGGIADIKNRTLRTVRQAGRVFGEDGLRLMRLARQAACLGFSPDEETKAGARKNAALVKDVALERVGAELCALLAADEKYGVTGGAYRGLCVLSQTGVLEEILPELAAGAGMQQRKDFHLYDVLEHSLRCVLYAPAPLRLAALLHDVGKPFCMRQDGNFHRHAVEGARLAREILLRLKFPKKTAFRTEQLVLWHMYDMQCETKENKLRRFFAEHYDLIGDLLALKQADFSACKDDLSPAPTVVRWKNILSQMQQEGAPLRLCDLKISGADLVQIGVPAQKIGTTLHELLRHCVCYPAENRKDRLLILAKSRAERES